MTIDQQIQTLISHSDQRRLRRMISGLRDSLSGRDRHYLARLGELEERLDQARALLDDGMPPNVVTMNSIVRLRELGTDRAQVLTLVYDGDAELFSRKLSVLTPLGLAILGAHVGEVVDWHARRGIRRVLVEELLFQPQRAGVVDL